MSRVCGCLGAGKAGREPVVWFSPRFFFFLCGADDGSRTRCLHLGGWRSGLVSYVRKCVFPGCPLRFLIVCALLSLGFGADDGG